MTDKSAGSPNSPFIYMLNAFELASQADNPAEQGYAVKRTHLLEYVATKERELVACRAELEARDTIIRARVQEINELNEVLRQAGWGQGEIDSAYEMLHKAESRLASHAERDGTYRLTKDEEKTLREGGIVSVPTGTRSLLPPAPSAASGLVEAAHRMDWQQVVLNGGPPCFHIDGGRFCGRAQRWEGHDEMHKFISLAALLRSRPAQGDSRDAERYRWWVEKYFGSDEEIDEINALKADGPVSWGEAIDAAMSQQEGK